LTFPDTVHVGSRITRMGRSSFTMEHRVISEAQRAIAAEGDSTLVAFDYVAQKPVPLSDDLRAQIHQLEGKSLTGTSEGVAP